MLEHAASSLYCVPLAPRSTPQGPSLVRCAQQVAHSLRDALGAQDAGVAARDAWPLTRHQVLQLVEEALGLEGGYLFRQAVLDL